MLKFTAKYICLFLFVTAISLTGQVYKKVVIPITNSSQLNLLLGSGIPLDHFEKRDGNTISLFLNEYELELLDKLNLDYDTEIEDWYNYVKKKKISSGAVEEIKMLSKANSNFKIKNFHFGSMAGYLTFAEVVEELDSMFIKYPNIISEKFSIGKTIENREQWVVKISDNPNIDEDEPEVLYTSLIHAREPQSLMTVIYFMHYLLANYGTDPEVTCLVDNRELHFIPVINPDGYQYNYETHPEGYGLWRKNKRDNNGDGKFISFDDGVDLNRNFGYKWGYDNLGSSAAPSSNVYRGASAFSEPETYNLKVFCEERNFVTAFNYHSYSNLMIIPWNFAKIYTPDSSIFNEYASDMTQFNKYEWGTAVDLLYAVNGDTDDWMYGEQSTKDKIFAMTPEVGRSTDSELSNGFWPDLDRIIPLAEENIFPNLYLAWIAGDYNYISKLKLANSSFAPGNKIDFEIDITNKGLKESQNLSLRVESNSSHLDIKERLEIIDPILARTTSSKKVENLISLSSEAEIGEAIEIIIVLQNDNIDLDKETIIVHVNDPTSSVKLTSSEIKYSLSQNYPNPFNPSTIINYSLAEDGFVSLEIFDLNGKIVSTLVNEHQKAGTYSITFQSNKSFASGFYFYRIKVNSYSETKKLLFIK